MVVSFVVEPILTAGLRIFVPLLVDRLPTELARVLLSFPPGSEFLEWTTESPDVVGKPVV
jgi:hypothetical protein